MAGNSLEVKEGSAGAHRGLSMVVRISQKGIDGGRPVQWSPAVTWGAKEVCGTWARLLEVLADWGMAGGGLPSVRGPWWKKRHVGWLVSYERWPAWFGGNLYMRKEEVRCSVTLISGVTR
jgi:hypothetical protein